MSDEIIGAIIGVSGTIVGIIIDRVITAFANRGKLVFYVKDWTKSYYRLNNGVTEITDFIPEAFECKYSFSIDIYNRSGNIKIARDIQIEFRNGRKELFSMVPQQKVEDKFEFIKPINVPSKTICCIDAYFFVMKEDNPFQLLEEYDKVYLKYRNEKGRIKKIKIV